MTTFTAIKDLKEIEGKTVKSAVYGGLGTRPIILFEDNSVLALRNSDSFIEPYEANKLDMRALGFVPDDPPPVNNN